MIEKSNSTTIEKHLLNLGGGNHDDNMRQVAGFECHWLVQLTKEEFFGLVFLQTDNLLSICPRGHDRTLRAVAERANRLGPPNLGPNWDLSENLRRMRELTTSGRVTFQPLLILESRPNEVNYGPFYLQDGSHRALAYAMLVMLGEVPYQDRLAYCSMNRSACNQLLARKI